MVIMLYLVNVLVVEVYKQLQKLKVELEICLSCLMVVKSGLSLEAGHFTKSLG